jgi:hypothetical protein
MRTMRSLLLFLVFPPCFLSAQPSRKIEGELSGSFFFGNTRQLLAHSRLEFERSDSAFAFRTMARMNYGETHTALEGAVVSKRSWDAVTSYEWRPFGDVSPLLRALLESSFENRIARRYSVTVGLRYNIIRTKSTELAARVGALSERTAALPPGDSLGLETIQRAMGSLRWKREFSERVSLTSENVYQPALSFSGDWTLVSVSALRVKLARFAALTTTFRDSYDSRAMLRGARTNNDGELLLGILTTF